MIKISLPDGSKMEMAEGVKGIDVALAISAGLAKAALAVKVNDKLQDLSTPITPPASASRSFTTAI